MIRILLRADAYPAIGTGDLMSLVYFSRHPKLTAKGWECHFMVRDHDTARKLLSSNGAAHVKLIPADASAAQETDEIIRYTETQGIDAVIFEITDRRLDTFNLSGINAVTGAVDFYNWIPKGLDLVVNWDTNSAGCYSPNDFPGTDFFLGPEYVFLHPDFFCGRRWQPLKNDPRPIVVAMGGADEFDLTGRILSELILRPDSDTSFVAIVGAGYADMGKLQDLAKQAGSRLTVKQNSADMYSEFLGARHVFGAGGLTAYELVILGAPCSLVACYAHQEQRCRAFAASGWVRYLGHRSDLPPIEVPPPAESVPSSSRFRSRLDRILAALETKIRLRRGDAVEVKSRFEEVGR